MGDVIFVATIVAFFALCVLFVKACDRISGPDLADDTLVESSTADEDAPTAEVAS